MTNDIREYRIHQHLVRTVTALCAFAAVCDDDARIELTDDAAFAVHIWTATAGDVRLNELRDWCAQTAGGLERMRGPGREHRALLRASLALLRLRSALTVPEKTVAPVKSLSRPSAPRKDVPPRPASLGANQKRLLEALRTAGPIRTRDLITHLAGQLSDRTIKRGLKELAVAGIVRRTESGGAVTYEAVAE